LQMPEITAALVTATLLGTSFTRWDALGFGTIFAMLVLISVGPKYCKNSAPSMSQKPEYK
ncbi:MAG TPA: hypothetical protein DHW78_09145, partial [Ruminococcaceae bacterium]|nr:hypothetical protein [Oscillospiraceae bacterium]